MFVAALLSLAIAGTSPMACRSAQSAQEKRLSSEQDLIRQELITPMMRVSATQPLPFTKVKTEPRRMIFPPRLGEKQLVIQWSPQIKTPYHLQKILPEAPPVWIEVGTNFVFMHLQPGALHQVNLPVLAQAFYGSSFFRLIEAVDPRISEISYQELTPGTTYVWSTPKNLNEGRWREFDFQRLGMTRYEKEVTELIQYARVYGKLPRDLQNTGRLWKHGESSYLIDALKREDEKTQAAFQASQPNAEKTDSAEAETLAPEIQKPQKSSVLRKSNGEKAAETIAAFIRAQGRKPYSQLERQLYSIMQNHQQKSEFIETLKKDPEVWLIFSTETRKGLSMENLAEAVSSYIRIHGSIPPSNGERAIAHLYEMMYKNRQSPTFIKHMLKDEKVWKIYSESIKREEAKAAENPKAAAKDLIRFIHKHLRKPIDQAGESQLFALISEHGENPFFLEEMQAIPKVWQIYSAPAPGRLKAEELIAFITANKRKPRGTSTGDEYRLYRAANDFKNDPEFIKAMEAEPKVYAIFKKPTSEKPKSIVEVDAESLIEFIDGSGQLPNPRRPSEKDLHTAFKRHEKNPDFLKLLARHPNVWNVVVEVAASELTSFISEYNRVPDWRQKSERELFETMKRFEKDPTFLEQMQSRARVWRIFEARNSALR